MKIKKIKSEGQYVYPATIAAAVKDANILDSSGKPMSQGEINAQQEEINKEQEDVNKQQEIINVQQNGVISRLILPDYTDLSFKDIFGDDLLTQSTANCYVVKTPGKYKLPLVYGNAIVNGQVNSKAYTNLEPDNPEFMDFVNAYGHQITSPYIEEDIKDIGKKCGSAQFTIGDADIFSDVGIQDGYLYFTLTSVPIGGANGVLSVKDSDGFIVWNWHIWAFPYDLTPETVTGADNANYEILPAYLATTYDDGDSLKRKNWFYQWGRSVPLPGASAYNSNTTISTYGESDFNIKTAYYSQPYQLGISTPTTFFSSEFTNGRWFGKDGGKYKTLWNSSNSDYYGSPLYDASYSNKIIKTIYDPSPSGFIVSSLRIMLSKLSFVGEFNYGLYIKRNAADTTGIFFPASGDRSTFGDLRDVGEEGFIHTCTTQNGNSVYMQSIDATGAYGDPYFIGKGSSVLCMKDPNVELEKGKHSITTIVEKQNTLAKQQEKNTKYIKKKKQTDVDRVVVRKCIPMGAHVGMKYLFDDGYIRFKITQKDLDREGGSIIIYGNFSDSKVPGEYYSKTLTSPAIIYTCPGWIEGIEKRSVPVLVTITNPAPFWKVGGYTYFDYEIFDGKLEGSDKWQPLDLRPTSDKYKVFAKNIVTIPSRDYPEYSSIIKKAPTFDYPAGGTYSLDAMKELVEIYQFKHKGKAHNPSRNDTSTTYKAYYSCYRRLRRKHLAAAVTKNKKWRRLFWVRRTNQDPYLPYLLRLDEMCYLKPV